MSIFAGLCNTHQSHRLRYQQGSDYSLIDSTISSLREYGDPGRLPQGRASWQRHIIQHRLPIQSPTEDQRHRNGPGIPMVIRHQRHYVAWPRWGPLCTAPT